MIIKAQLWNPSFIYSIIDWRITYELIACASIFTLSIDDIRNGRPIWIDNYYNRSSIYDFYN